jgi:hypothetical protein
MSHHPQSAKHPKPTRKAVSRTPAWITPVAVLAAIILIVVGFLLIRWYTTPLAPTPLPTDTTQQVVSALAHLPSSELDSVGVGSAKNTIKPVAGEILTGPTGKPMLFYYGAEFCPYCAAERWPLIVALSRFGTFSGLHTSTSASNDIYPDTPTFTFHGASFSSQYLDFGAVETTDRDRNPLETPTAAQTALVNQYDTTGSIPFIDLGNRYAFAGAMYLPDILGGMSWQAIADSLAQPSSPQAMAIIGYANLITAAVCLVTGGQPVVVCSSASVRAIEKQLG